MRTVEVERAIKRRQRLLMATEVGEGDATGHMKRCTFVRERGPGRLGVRVGGTIEYGQTGPPATFDFPVLRRFGRSAGFGNECEERAHVVNCRSQAHPKRGRIHPVIRPRKHRGRRNHLDRDAGAGPYRTGLGREVYLDHDACVSSSRRNSPAASSR